MVNELNCVIGKAGTSAKKITAESDEILYRQG